MESSEHVHVGNAITLTMADGSKAAASTVELPVHSMPLTYGQIVALGGDFYGTTSLQPISTSSDPRSAANDAFGTLNMAPTSEVSAILAVIAEEQAAVAAVPPGQQPSTAFAKLGNSLSYKWNEITGGGPASEGDLGLALHPGRYMNLATVNMDHFGPQAVAAYTAGHNLALAAATKIRGGHAVAPPDVQDQILRMAYAANAFADHFLTDLFAAGHVRTPRYPLYEMTLSPKAESGFVAKCMHDEDNLNGLHLTNARGKSWVAYGDGKELDDVNKDNLAMAIAAAQASADEVYAAFASGNATVASPAALQLVPRELTPPPQEPTAAGNPNYAPLFWADPKDYVYRRGGLLPTGWRDRNNFDYTYYWSSKLMCLEIFSGFGADTPTGFR